MEKSTVFSLESNGRKRFHEIQIDRPGHRSEWVYPFLDRLLWDKQLHRSKRDRHDTTSNKIDSGQFFSSFYECDEERCERSSVVNQWKL